MLASPRHIMPSVARLQGHELQAVTGPSTWSPWSSATVWTEQRHASSKLHWSSSWTNCSEQFVQLAARPLLGTSRLKPEVANESARGQTALRAECPGRHPMELRGRRTTGRPTAADDQRQSTWACGRGVILGLEHRAPWAKQSNL